MSDRDSIDPIDWEQIKLLYCQGIGAGELGKRFSVKANTIQQRACREKWTRLRAISKEAVIRSLQVETARADIASIAARVKERMATDVEKMLDELERRKLDKLNLAELESRERIAKSLQTRAWPVLGLDNAANTAAVNINIMAQLVESAAEPIEISSQPENPSRQAQIVDAVVVPPSETESE